MNLYNINTDKEIKSKLHKATVFSHAFYNDWHIIAGYKFKPFMIRDPIRKNIETDEFVGFYCWAELPTFQIAKLYESL